MLLKKKLRPIIHFDFRTKEEMFFQALITRDSHRKLDSKGRHAFQKQASTYPTLRF